MKRIRALQQKKFRKETGLFVVEGVKTVQELVHSGIEIESIYSTESFDFLNGLAPESVFLIKENELARISGLSTPNRILAVAKIPKQPSIDWNCSLIIVLDGINDPGNLGTIIRSAKWFGVNTIVCSEDCVDAFDRKVVQSTMGALFHVNVQYKSLIPFIEDCKRNGFVVIGAAMNGESMYHLSRPVKTALVIGSESHGISESVLKCCDQLLTIPNNESQQRVESLNAGVATSIILSELTRPI